jgi:eukaryotic-like serine/threonine-protein kinase
MPSKQWEQIEAIFLTAADLPRAEQQDFLDHACRGDDELRREVESLLDSDRKSGEKITRAVENEAESLFGLSPIIGSRLGAWRVIRELGRGGMGAVYLAARDDDQFHKNVAIKLVKRGMDTTDVLRRFQHERQILAGLDHAYIARLIDAGTAPDGRPFFVMEYVEGQPIDTYCFDQKLSIAARCRLFVKVCEAVSHAHRHLVVHRDLKPGNIIVTPDGTPKLLDFGVAKLLAPEADPHLTVTGMQSRLLTPQYASPEQVTGRPVHTSSDVYSLGAVLYELLTGSCAQHLDSTAREEIERVICVEEAPLPSSVKPGVPADLDNIVMMAMRKDPSRRYHSVDQLADDIQRYLDGRPVLARKDSLSYRAGKFVGRNRLTIAAASVVVASLVGGIVIAMSQARRAERRLEQMVELANRSLFDVHTAIERLPGSTTARKAIVKTTLEFLENLSKDAGRDDRLRLPLAAAYYRLGDVQGYQFKPNLGDTSGALDSYRKAAAMLEPLRLKHPNDPEIQKSFVDIYDHMGSVLNGTGDIAATVKAYETALPAAQSLVRLLPNDKEAAQNQGVFYNDLARALTVSDSARAYEYASRHLALIPGLLKQFPGDDDIADEAAFAHTTMGEILSRRGQLPEALAEMRQDVAIREDMRARHPDDAVRRRTLMLAYGHVAALLGSPMSLNIGDPKGAREYYDKCVAIAREIATADPQDRTAQYDLASSLLRQGAVEVPAADLPQSLAELREAAGILESLAHSDPNALRYTRAQILVYQYAGFRLRDLHKTDEALAEWRRAVAVADSIMAAHPGDASTLPPLVRTEGEIAILLLSRGDSAGALAHAQRGLSISQKYANGPEPLLRVTYVGNATLVLASVHQKLGQTQLAHDEATQALAAFNTPGALAVTQQHRDQAAAILDGRK